MAALFGLTIDHRPLMQAEAAVERRACRDRTTEPQAEIQAAGLRCVWQGHPHESVGASQEAAIVDEFIRLSQRHAGTRRPASDSCKAERIIGEEKILNGIALALLGAFTPSLNEPIRTGLMRRAASPPFRGTQHDLTGRLDSQSKRR